MIGFLTPCTNWMDVVTWTSRNGQSLNSKFLVEFIFFPCAAMLNRHRKVVFLLWFLNRFHKWAVFGRRGDLLRSVPYLGKNKKRDFFVPFAIKRGEGSRVPLELLSFFCLIQNHSLTAKTCFAHSWFYMYLVVSSRSSIRLSILNQS